MQLTVPNRDGPQLGDPSDDVVPVERVLSRSVEHLQVVVQSIHVLVSV